VFNFVVDMTRELRSVYEGSVLAFLDKEFETVYEIVQNNNRRVWNTRGTSIGEDWKGYTLVDTGELRRALTDALVLDVVDNNVVWDQGPAYGFWVIQRWGNYLGLDELAQDEMLTAYRAWLSEEVKRVFFEASGIKKVKL